MLPRSGSTDSKPARWPRARRAVLGLLAACCALFILDAAVFRTGVYYCVLEPASFAGEFERSLREERARPLDSRRQVLMVGDSRAQAFRPRIAAQLTGGREFAFGNAAVRGSSPRGWYYLLRDLDPHSARYTAILIGLDSFDDEDGWEDHADRLLDLQMAVGSLGLRDLIDFPFSFPSAYNQRQAFLGCLLKGSAYKKDFQEFLAHPTHRWLEAAYYRAWSVSKNWETVGSDQSLAGLQVDWATRKLTLPESTDAYTRMSLKRDVENPSYPQIGREAAFRRLWLGRLADHYRASHTLLIFLRLPRSPIPRPPSLAPSNLPSVLRELAGSRPNILLADEHAFESLEKPEFFLDWAHANAAGARGITRIAVAEMRSALARAYGRF